ncbi:hypothetical protein GALMADRAFT_236015 [Galerina marginata CBS 339.88]|uniref:DUF7704 domain-containing protein n=1 Tax=Galerina marginata (strain CBS 339.88) TaxID=685588 RepID=A0A067TKJ2_GALM3|nr:hypothetical protein GALMADRAFT_236015 [Galerina marginata CBS 339.88]
MLRYTTLPKFQLTNKDLQSKSNMPPQSAIPDFYYFCFGAYEPFLTIVGFLGALADPLSAHNSQAPWSADALPYQVLPTATLVTILQLAHVCALLGCVNLFVLSAVRKHLSNNLALQENIVFSLMTPLLIGDIFHMWLTFWALKDQRSNFQSWSPMLWTTVILGFSLMIPRICWHLGIGRYVDSRDGSFREAYAPVNKESFKS